MNLMQHFVCGHIARLDSLAPHLEGAGLSVTTWSTRFLEQPVVLVQSEDTPNKGALGAVEIDLICSAFAYAAEKHWPVVLYLNSSGARLNEGDGIQASFRKLLNAALVFRSEGHRIVVLMGKNVFGGASLLAMSGHTRIYSEATRVSMTGPRVLEGQPENQPHDIRAIIAAKSRVRNDAFGVWSESLDDVKEHLLHALSNRDPAPGGAELVKASNLLFASSRVQVSQSGIRCIDTHPPHINDLLALILAVSKWDSSVELVITCEWLCHSLDAADENAYQSYWLFSVSETIYRKQKEGCQITCHFAKDVSGGLYIALAAAVTEVTAASGVGVQALPYGIVDQIVTSATARKKEIELIELKIIDRIEGPQ
ncbi:hypothetical protein [uncultured Marinobacter sp.]|uniref:hypothetical protein n=1 Tax=uncultured Marinobacter sp. TaxID=187379 RepID=UPI00263826CB|nr:hypothetical protein [uncultured Marinobacter sp.]